MKVIEIDSGKVYTVYGTRYYELFAGSTFFTPVNGAEFLIYEDNKWSWVDVVGFKPFEE